MRYLAYFGNEGSPMELADIGQAQTWLWETVKAMKEEGRLPAWRAMALRTQIENMPNAGLSFTVDGIGLIAARKV